MQKTFTSWFSHLRGDIFGGLTAGIVALPLALAFGEQTALGAIAGLYGAIAIGIFAALFGGTPSQISGPTAPMTVISAVAITEAIRFAGGLTEAMPIIIAIFFLAGLIELGFGLLRIGRNIKFIPYPVVSGFMSGIGVIIIIGQIFPFFGAESPAGGAWAVLGNLSSIPELFNPWAVLLAASTIAIIYLFPKITKVAPGNLVALVLVSGAAFLFLSPGAVRLINDSTPGGVPTGLPQVQLGFWAVLTDLSNIRFIMGYAFTLAALGAIDSLLTSVVADNLTKTRHNSDRELIGQGIGNMAAALIGGLPGAGATMRTVVNINAGGKTRLSGVIAGLLLLAILLGLGPLVGNIPNPVLAGILLVVGINIIDFKGLSRMKAMPKADAVVMVLVLLITVFVGLLEAVAVGLVLAALLFMKNIADVIEHRTKSAPIAAFAREIPWADEATLNDKIGRQVFIKHLDGPLFFGFASRFQEMVRALPQIKVVILRMGRVPYIDQSGLYALESAVEELQQNGILVLFTGLRGQPLDMVKRIKLVPGLIPEEHCFATFTLCAEWLESYLEKNNYFSKTASPNNGASG